MVSALSKRQQARNERALQELIKSVPGNDRCADCGAKNPGWASWNLGAFLCMRCAALHRKLGTHISKVKSLSMDSWSSDQVDNMKRNGNNAVNKLYNPRNVKPSIPMDVDEQDSVMERFIRQKYEHKVLEDGKPKPPSRHDTGYTSRSSEGEPPAPPPKTGKRFGFGLRSVSSAYSFGRSEKSSIPTAAVEDSVYDSPLNHQNKPSRVFGANIGDGNASFETKLEMLRDMGFSDTRRNATVLKGLNGDLDRTVEQLAKLGEGPEGGVGARASIPNSNQNMPSASSSNPFDQLDSASWQAANQNNSGLSFGTQPTTSAAGQVPNAQPASYNPFDIPASQPAPSAQALTQSFQNLQVSQPLFPNTTGGYPSQHGGVQQPRYQQSMTPPVAYSQQGVVASPAPLNGDYNPFFQPAPSQPNGAGNPLANPYVNQQQTASSANPFFTQTSPSVGGQPQFQAPQAPSSYAEFNGSQLTQPRHAHTMPVYSSTSPFSQAQQQPPQAQQLQQPQQPQQPQQVQAPYNPFAAAPANGTNNPFQNQQIPGLPQQGQPQPQIQPQMNNNPFPTYAQQPQLQQQFHPQMQNQVQPLMPQQTGRVDKSAILALYNFSQPPPTIQEQPQQPQQPQPQQQPQRPQQHQQSQQQQQTQYQHSQYGTGSAPQGNPVGPPASMTQAPVAQNYGMPPPHASMSAPTSPGMAGNRNPFFTAAPAAAGPSANTQPQAPSYGGAGFAAQPTNNPFPTHSSRESVLLSGVQNGRHSPDAFASLSARYQ